MPKVTELKPNLYQRIHSVAKEIGVVEKNGVNSFHRYEYATERDFVDAVRPLLDKHGLVLVPEVIGEPMMTPIGDKGELLTQLLIKFTLVNIDNPNEKEIAIIPGHGQDKGDKGVYKALTGAKKYFLSLTFLIATGDDPENDDDKPAKTITKKENTTQGNARKY